MRDAAEKKPDWIFFQEKSNLAEFDRVYLSWFCSKSAAEDKKQTGWLRAKQS